MFVCSWGNGIVDYLYLSYRVYETTDGYTGDSAYTFSAYSITFCSYKPTLPWVTIEKATGDRIQADDAIVIDFKQNRIGGWREYFDTQTPKLPHDEKT